jgi:predicted amidohydrolase
MKIGFVQFCPELADLRKAIQKIEELSDSFKSADLLVLPELCNSGYNFQSKQQAWDTSEEITKSSFVSFLLSLSKEYDLHIVSGINERFKNKLYNSAVLIGPDGLRGHYRKLHLFKNEKDFFTPGNLGLPVFDIPGCRIGILVCFDWIFPEVWRILALKGADIICHPSNLVLPGLAQRGVPAHALMNRVFTITANRIGTERELTFTGMSIISDPKGNIIAQASQNEDAVHIVDIDINQARNKMVTERNDIFEDRREDVYRLEIVNPSDTKD